MLALFKLTFFWSLHLHLLSGFFWMGYIAIGRTLVLCGSLWRGAPFGCLGHPRKHFNHTPEKIANQMTSSSQGDREAIRERQFFVRRAHRDIPSFHREYLGWLAIVRDCICVFWCIAQLSTVLLLVIEKVTVQRSFLRIGLLIEFIGWPKSPFVIVKTLLVNSVLQYNCRGRS